MLLVNPSVATTATEMSHVMGTRTLPASRWITGRIVNSEQPQQFTKKGVRVPTRRADGTCGAPRRAGDVSPRFFLVLGHWSLVLSPLKMPII